MILFPHFDLSTILWGLGAILPVLALTLSPEVDPEDPVFENPPAPTDPGAEGGTTGGGGYGDITVTSGSRTLISVDQNAHTCVYRLSGSFTGNSDGDTIRKRTRTYKAGVQETNTNNGTVSTYSSSWYSDDNAQSNPTCECDNSTYSWRAVGLNVTENLSVNGETLYFRSAAVTAVAAAPTAPTVGAGTLGATEAHIATTCYPNTLHSVATLQLQYKRSVDSTWVDFGTSSDTSGYASVSFARNLTGLTPSTSYDVRLKITRTTVNETLTYSNVTTFSTVIDDPTITTVAASSVGATSSVINGTVDIGGESSVNVKFKYGTASDLAGGTTVAFASNPVTANGNVSYALTGLTVSTTYYFRAEVYWNSDTESATGSILSFTTAGSQTGATIEEDMLPIQDFDRKYGVETTIYFVVAAPSGSSSNLFYTGGAVWAGAGESKISKDGAAFADTTNDPAQVEGALYSLTLTATEMQCNEAYVILNEAGATAARDTLLRVRTHLQLGSVDIDAATGAKANTTAFKVTGYGSGHGFSAVAGATGQEINGVLGDHVHRGPLECQAATGTGTEIKLDLSASSNDDYYNGCIISVIAGTGAYQSRVITDYNGTTKVATVHKEWKGSNPTTSSYFIIEPGPDVWEIPNTGELASVPAVTGTMRQLLTFVWQRFKFKRTMTATAFTMYKDNGSDPLGSGATVSDDGTTQTHGEYS